MNNYELYANFIRPDWAPPAWLFGPVWTILYILIAISFVFVFYKAYMSELPRVITIPFALNLVFNFAFTPIQFGLQNNLLASIDIILVFITILWFMKAIWPFHRWVALINIPYLLWVSFATILQLTITSLNW